MPKDSMLMKRLVHAKQIFQHGADHAGRPGDLNRLFAILAFDQSIEHFLNTTIYELSGKVKNARDPKFQDLIDGANTALENHGKQKLGAEANIWRVHRIRNNAQHLHQIPSSDDVSDARVYTRDFLKESFGLCFSKVFDEVFLADSIESEKVREHFRKAEMGLNGGVIDNAIMELAICLQYALQDLAKKVACYRLREPLAWKESHLDHLLGALELDNAKERAFRLGLREFVEEVKRQVNELHERAEMLAMKVDLFEYEFFRSVAPQVGFVESGEPRVYSPGSPCQSRDDCIRAFNFVFSVVLGIESLS